MRSALICFVVGAAIQIQGPAGSEQPNGLVSGPALIFPIAPRVTRVEADKGSDGGICNTISGVSDHTGALDSGQFDAIISGMATGYRQTFCNARAAANALFVSDQELLRPDVNLAAARGIESEVCEPSKWRVVSVTLRSCHEYFSLREGAHRPTQCDAVFAVTVQPFSQNEFGWAVHDHALHLFYVASNLSNRSMLQHAFWQDARNTLDQYAHKCNAPEIASIRKTIVDTLAETTLREVDFVLSSKSGQQWTFGKLEVDSRGSRPLRLQTGDLYENFSLPDFLRGECSTSIRSNDSGILYNCGKVDAVRRRTALHELTKQLGLKDNPNGSGSCLNCHFGQQLQTLGEIHAPLDQHSMSLLARRGLKTGNFRQFGYDYNGFVSISNRAVESFRARKLQ